MRGIELQSDRDERDTVLFERLHQPGKIHQRAAETVNLVDHHAVDLALLDVVHQTLQCWTLNVAARESAVVVSIRETDPAFTFLPGDAAQPLCSDMFKESSAWYLSSSV